MLTVKQEFSEIIKIEKQMLAQSGNDLYYKMQDALKGALSVFIRNADLKQLSTKQLLKICALTGSHNPVPLHVFFIHCAKHIND